MRIVIVGCGKVGTALARSLSQEDNNICIVDVKSDVVHQIATENDIMGMVGNGASYSVLKEAGIETADLLIAVTESDELNLLCCVIARKASKCQTIARVRNPMYSQEKRFLQRELGLSMIINPEQTAAAEIASVLGFPSALGIDSFAGGKVEMIRFRIPAESMLDNMSLKAVSAMVKCDFLICAVDRGGKVEIPGGNFVLQSGDLVSLVTSRQSAKMFFEQIHMNTNRARNTMIVGGGKITLYLAKMLDNLELPSRLLRRARSAARN